MTGRPRPGGAAANRPRGAGTTPGPEGAADLLAPGTPLPIVHRAALLFIFALIAALSIRQVGSPDIGFHLKTGDWILSGHGWPRTDPFTDTMKGHPYTDTSWGYDVLVALLFRVGGTAALVLFHAALIVGLFFVLLRTARLASISPAVLVLAFLLGGLAGELRYEPRPEIVSYLFLAVMIWLLARRAAGRRLPVWALPALQLAWANLHSLFLLGWVVQAAFLIGESWRRRRLDRDLARALALSVGVSFVNPYFIRGVLFPLALLTRFRQENVFAQTIGEFVSPFTLNLGGRFPSYPRPPIAGYQALAVLSLFGAWAAWRRRSYGALLVWLALTPLSVRMIRNIPLFVIAALPLVAVLRPPGALRRPVVGRTVAILCGLLALGLSLRVIHDAYYIQDRRTERFGLGWNHLALPVDAADYARRAGLPGAMLNHINFGGYLMWALPKPVYIDGRLEVAAESFFNDYQQAMLSEIYLEGAVARGGIGWIVFPYAGDPALLKRLSGDPRWKLTYFDHLAAIFVRVGAGGSGGSGGNAHGRGGASGGTPGGAVSDSAAGAVAAADAFVDPAVPAALAAKFDPASVDRLPGMGASPRPSPWARRLASLTRREVYPFEDFYRGLFHSYRGEYEPAGACFAAAIQKSGGAYLTPYANLGIVLRRLKDDPRARRAYEIVLAEEPGNRRTRERLKSLDAGQ